MFRASSLTRGPWHVQQQHAGPPIALIAYALEAAAQSHGLAHMARLTANLLRPVPIADITVQVQSDYVGRNAGHFSAVALADGKELMRATALFQREAEVALPEVLAGHPLPLVPQARVDATVQRMQFPHREIGYSDLMETRVAAGKMFDGPSAVWFRLRHPLVAGHTPSPYQRVAVAADSGNGVSAILDLSGRPHPPVQQRRRPGRIGVVRRSRVDWTGDAEFVCAPAGVGSAHNGAVPRFQGGLMADSDKVFSGSIPKSYDTLMVPLIFQGYADDTAQRVAAFTPNAVLETAAGSGVVTRALAPQLRPDARYVVTDLNQPMLDYAATRQGADSRIEWRQADALALPFADATFDMVCCQFGAMFFPNRVTGYAEARRVLKPGGRFVFAVWDRIEENAFADDVTQAVATVFPHDPPRFLARTPHGYHDVALIREELGQAGFTHIQIETREKLSHAPSARAVATAYCQGTPLRNEIEARDASKLELATDRATEAIAHRHGDGPVAGKIQAHVIVAAG